MSTTIEAMKTAVNQVLDSQLDEWRRIVTGLDAEALNWKPGEDTNSISALVAHSMDATRYHLANALGITLDRNREEKFDQEAASADDLLALIDATEADMRDYVSRLTEDVLPVEQTRPSSITGSRTHNGAYYLLHALQHDREHIGQASLTRQLFEQRHD
ncbi:hypothetical protein BH23CHL2_BH23CHL2_36210 [soil metagenome]